MRRKIDMPWYQTFLITLLIILPQWSVSIAKDNDIIEFEKSLFAPVDITKRVILSPQTHGQLTERDKKDLMEAKQALVDFLKSFKDKDKNPLNYLSLSLRKSYGDRVKLYREEFPGAEAIMNIVLDDYLIKRYKNEVVFYSDVTTTFEGEYSIKRKAFALIKTPQGWKLSRFNENIKSREVEERENKK